jgi:hypothetical protein
VARRSRRDLVLGVRLLRPRGVPQHRGRAGSSQTCAVRGPGTQHAGPFLETWQRKSRTMVRLRRLTGAAIYGRHVLHVRERDDFSPRCYYSCHSSHGPHSAPSGPRCVSKVGSCGGVSPPPTHQKSIAASIGSGMRGCDMWLAMLPVAPGRVVCRVPVPSAWSGMWREVTVDRRSAVHVRSRRGSTGALAGTMRADCALWARRVNAGAIGPGHPAVLGGSSRPLG